MAAQSQTLKFKFKIMIIQTKNDVTIFAKKSN